MNDCVVLINNDNEIEIINKYYKYLNCKFFDLLFIFTNIDFFAIIIDCVSNVAGIDSLLASEWVRLQELMSLLDSG